MSQGRVAPEDRAAKRLHDWTAEPARCSAPRNRDLARRWP